MIYEELTTEQQTGINYNAAHNLRSLSQYIAWRLEQDEEWDIEKDGDRGYAEMQSLIVAGIPLPEVVPEPEPTPEWTPGEPEETEGEQS